MPLLVAPEAPSFIALLLLLLVGIPPCINVHWLPLSSVCCPSASQVSVFVVGRCLACRGTCCATCSVLVATGGGNLLEVPRHLLLVVPLFDAVGLVVGLLLLAFFVHEKDSLLPFQVCAGYVDADVGDDGGISCGDASSYSLDKESSFAFVITSSG